MGNTTASTKKQRLFEEARFGELLEILDDGKASDVTMKGMVLFAQGALDDFLNFVDRHMSQISDKMGSCDGASEDRRELQIMRVGLLIEQAFVVFLLHGGLSGSQGKEVMKANAWLEEAFEAFEEAQLAAQYNTLINAFVFMFKGHRRGGDRDLLESAVQLSQAILREDSSGNDMHFLHHFLMHITKGLCTLKLFHVTADTHYLQESYVDALEVMKQTPNNDVMQDLWYNELQALDVWTAVGQIPTHYALCSATPPRVKLDSIADVFVGQRHLIDQLTRIFEQRQRNLLPTDRPLVLWFSGASGHGKTYLARLIAEVVHSTCESPQEEGTLVVVNCQNLRTNESVNSLVDPPTGIKGRGPLIAGLEKHADAVILLDELDKAAVAAVENVFLPAFERGGYLQSAKDGRVVRTNQAIFIITSNIGADVIKKDAKEYTASRTTAEQRRELESAWWQRIVHTLQQTYTAPFLNRSTANLFVFTPYTRAECERAVTLELQRWARHLVTATGPLVQWTQTVVKFFADNFDQFHGQKVVTSCADALNAAMNDGHESRYFLLTVSASQLRAEPLAEAVQRVKAPPRILRSALPAELLSDTAACPDDPQALLAAVLGLVPGTAPSLPSAVAPVGDNPPTPPPRPPAPAPPETSAQDTAPSGGASEAEWRRETEPEREMALIHKEREILALQQRALQSEAETEQLRQQLAQAQAENEALQATVADKDREIASLLETVKALQMSVLVLLFTSCFLVWVMTWLVPTELLMMGVLAMGFGIWMAWGRLSWWLLPVLGALKKVLGEQGTAILLFVLLVLIAHRLKSGPVQWGCSQGEGFD